MQCVVRHVQVQPSVKAETRVLPPLSARPNNRFALPTSPRQRGHDRHRWSSLIVALLALLMLSACLCMPTILAAADVDSTAAGGAAAVEQVAVTVPAATAAPPIPADDTSQHPIYTANAPAAELAAESTTLPAAQSESRPPAVEATNAVLEAANRTAAPANVTASASTANTVDSVDTTLSQSSVSRPTDDNTMVAPTPAASGADAAAGPIPPLMAAVALDAANESVPSQPAAAAVLKPAVDAATAVHDAATTAPNVPPSTPTVLPSVPVSPPAVAAAAADVPIKSAASDELPPLNVYKAAVLEKVEKKRKKNLERDASAEASAALHAATVAQPAVIAVNAPAPTHAGVTTATNTIVSAPAAASTDKAVTAVDSWAAEQERLSVRLFPVPMDEVHEHNRFNYASYDAGAKLLSTSDEVKKGSSILINDDDRYMMVPCSTPDIFFVIQLSEDIIIDQIELANLEHYSGSLKDFTVLGSATYPAQNQAAAVSQTHKWAPLGSFTALRTNQKQTFKIPSREWVRFLKIMITSHYGDEYYCTLTYFRVYGTTMLDSFRDELEIAQTEVQEITREMAHIKGSSVADDDDNLAPATALPLAAAAEQPPLVLPVDTATVATLPLQSMHLPVVANLSLPSVTPAVPAVEATSSDSNVAVAGNDTQAALTAAEAFSPSRNTPVDVVVSSTTAAAASPTAVAAVDSIPSNSPLSAASTATGTAASTEQARVNAADDVSAAAAESSSGGSSNLSLSRVLELVTVIAAVETPADVIVFASNGSQKAQVSNASNAIDAQPATENKVLANVVSAVITSLNSSAANNDTAVNATTGNGSATLNATVAAAAATAAEVDASMQSAVNREETLAIVPADSTTNATVSSVQPGASAAVASNQASDVVPVASVAQPTAASVKLEAEPVAPTLVEAATAASSMGADKLAAEKPAVREPIREATPTGSAASAPTTRDTELHAPSMPKLVLPSTSGGSGSGGSSAEAAANDRRGGQRSIFKQLTDRIKDLEIHQALIGKYVNELSERYVRDMAALQQKFDLLSKTMQAHVARTDKQWSEGFAGINATVDALHVEQQSMQSVLRDKVAEASFWVRKAETSMEMHIGFYSLLALFWLFGWPLLNLLWRVVSGIANVVLTVLCCRCIRLRRQRRPSRPVRHVYSKSNPDEVLASFARQLQAEQQGQRAANGTQPAQSPPPVLAATQPAQRRQRQHAATPHQRATSLAFPAQYAAAARWRQMHMPSRLDFSAEELMQGSEIYAPAASSAALGAGADAVAGEASHVAAAIANETSLTQQDVYNMQFAALMQHHHQQQQQQLQQQQHEQVSMMSQSLPRYGSHSRLDRWSMPMPMPARVAEEDEHEATAEDLRHPAVPLATVSLPAYMQSPPAHAPMHYAATAVHADASPRSPLSALPARRLSMPLSSPLALSPTFSPVPQPQPQPLPRQMPVLSPAMGGRQRPMAASPVGVAALPVPPSAVDLLAASGDGVPSRKSSSAALQSDGVVSPVKQTAASAATAAAATPPQSTPASSPLRSFIGGLVRRSSSVFSARDAERKAQMPAAAVSSNHRTATPAADASTVAISKSKSAVALSSIADQRNLTPTKAPAIAEDGCGDAECVAADATPAQTTMTTEQKVD